MGTVSYPDVAADNNHAEKQIRFAVIMRKNYFGNRSMRGAETQAILMSVFTPMATSKSPTRGQVKIPRATVEE
jgi:hypothetical protein